MKLKKNNRSRNWYAVYVDERGHLRERTTGTAIKKLAGEIAAKWAADALAVREGLVDPAQLAQRDAARRPIEGHLADYLEWCRSAGQDPEGLRTKETQIRSFLGSSSCRALRDVTPAALVRFMREVVGRGRAPRTANLHRMNVVAFMNWCRDDRRLATHDLNKRTVPKLEEARDCRRKRRALTEPELGQLRMVSLPSGRWWAYQLAIWTGLRRGELAKLRWSDIDLETDELHVRASISKNGQSATLPILPPARESLEALRRLNPGAELVMPRVPADDTLYADLERAGIQGRTATGSCATNAAGERVDFHALRTTCGTMLANAGVPVMHLKRMMRHANIATTDRHYTKLRTTDLRSGIESALARPAALAATGTDGLPPQLPPATATNGVFRDASGRKGLGVAKPSARAASGSARGEYVHPSASRSDRVQMPLNPGPVAQRPTEERSFQAGKHAAAGGLPTRLPPTDATEVALELLIATLTPAARARLRRILDAPDGPETRLEAPQRPTGA